ncbi:phage tail domain-containing protein [Exiguobacterium sp.]|uniref:phage tail domain-containing protein n=1 Tax=Exiguobacterium sp. TaxID=44751 RepID=UPI00257E99F7|nr:phage tail domain-containing protein [Exiguobacterium sp.]
MTFTNSSGESITFRLGSPFMINNIEGLGEVSADIQSQKAPFQDGSSFIDAVMNERDISFNVTIKGRNDSEISQYRTQLSRVFSPKLGPGTLRYQYGDIVRVIEATPTHVPNFPSGNENRGSQFQIALLDLIAHDPYWKTEGIEGEPTFEPLFQFPFSGEFQMGISRDERLIVNDGDAPTPLVVEFYGPAVNPKVINETTGEFIQLNQTLGLEEVMRINTADGEKSVIFIDAEGVERNVFNWIDLDSTFFKLQVGENYLTYTADSDIQGAVVNFYYQNRYNAL